mgnify:CR=1 FL=1
MKFHYYADTDSLYIDLSDTSSADSREVAPGVVLDFDADDRLVGIDIDQASRIVDLTRLEADALPVSKVSLMRP